jgi:hypothetical protein
VFFPWKLRERYSWPRSFMVRRSTVPEAMPSQALPCLAPPQNFLTTHAMPYPTAAHLALPDRTWPNLTVPHLTAPRHAGPRLATSCLEQIKRRNLKAPVGRTEISHPDQPSSGLQDFVRQRRADIFGK